MKEIRLQKFIADAGIASRRKAEELIRQGRVKVDGETVTELGRKVTGAEAVEVNGRPVAVSEKKVYIILNKPEGYVTTVKDQFSRKTVLDLVAGASGRLFPVGRLDYDTSGLLLLTNDGELTYKLTHPSHEIDKTYLAKVLGAPSAEKLKALERGIELEGAVTAPSRVKLKTQGERTSVLEVVIHEGRNRQVRKMLEAIGHPVVSLKRTEFGGLGLEGLPEGKWRYLKSHEVEQLKRL